MATTGAVAGVWLLLLSLGSVRGSGGIGLSAARPLSFDDPDKIFSTRKQRRMCERMPGMKRILLEAVRLSADSCTQLMTEQRWNCSLGPSRIRILQKAFKETAFLYSITSAAIAHMTARACAAGQLTACTCDLSAPAGEQAVAERWRWGGCGHNVRFAGRFTRRLLRRGGRGSRQRRARRLVHWHNWKVGIKTVMSGMVSRCKCHGVSGSCQLRTCWKQVGQFPHTAAAVVRKYQTATRRTPEVAPEVDTSGGAVSLRTNTIISRRRRRGRGGGQQRPPPGGPRRRLVFSDKSPSYCEPDGYGPGTTTRQCQLGRHCAVLCCGRGYNTQVRSLVSTCNCHVLWHQRTFKVDCQMCTNVTEVYTCK